MTVAIVALAAWQLFWIYKCLVSHRTLFKDRQILAKYRDQIGTDYPDLRTPFARSFAPYWDSVNPLALVLLPLAYLAIPSPIFVVLWLLVPWSHFCMLGNKLQILQIQILNSELEILKGCYDNQATAN